MESRYKKIFKPRSNSTPPTTRKISRPRSNSAPAVFSSTTTLQQPPMTQQTGVQSSLSNIPISPPSYEKQNKTPQDDVRSSLSNIPMSPSTSALTRPTLWKKVGNGVEPIDGDPRYTLILGSNLQPPPPESWEEGDIWDSETGNVYGGKTHKLKKNYSTGQTNTVLPDNFLKEFDKLNLNTTGLSKKNLDNHRVRLNRLKGEIGKWLKTEGINDNQKREAGALLKRIEHLQIFDLYAEPLPETSDQRVVLAHALASESLYKEIKLARAMFSSINQTQVPLINSAASNGTSNSNNSEEMSIGIGSLQPEGSGLKWWASAAMGLRDAAKKNPAANNNQKEAQILHLKVGKSGSVPIALRTPSEAKNEEGEFIVLGQEAPVAYDLNPDKLGLRTPPSDDSRHQVSYPAFKDRLKNIRARPQGESSSWLNSNLPEPILSDKQIAEAMLSMVENPEADVESVHPADLGTLQELLVTWMVAEPARHRSTIFNSVLILEQIAEGKSTFEDALADAGIHPMTGEGTAEGGRAAEKREGKVLKGDLQGFGDLTKMRDARVVSRQIKQIKNLNPENLSVPLQSVLRKYDQTNVSLRPIPDKEERPLAASTKVKKQDKKKERRDVNDERGKGTFGKKPAEKSIEERKEDEDEKGLRMFGMAPQIIKVSDVSSFLRPGQDHVWNDDAVGRDFKGKDNSTYKLIKFESGIFHFQRKA